MSTDRAKHTPTPYHYELHPRFCVIRSNEPDDRAIAHVIREMDAAFMVQACNSFDSLLAACEAVASGDGHINHRRMTQLQAQCRAAIKLAGEA
jgi:hypothetical protein